MRRLQLLGALSILDFINISTLFGIPEKQILLIQQLGAQLPDEDITLVKQALAGFYDVQIRMLPRVDLPDQAYYEPRRRYRAEKLLPFLLEKLPSDGDRILGLTGVDISTDNGKIKDWVILGLANLGGKECIVFAYRCYGGSGKAPMRVFFLPRLPCMRSATLSAWITAPQEGALWKMPED